MKILFTSLLLISVLSCKQTINPTQNLIFELEVIVLHNDEFQLFYSNDFINEFKETASVKIRVVGKPNVQIIKFLLPAVVNPSRIRIDLGNNSSQSLIIINKISIVLGNYKIIYKDKLKNNEFLANDCITLYENNYNLKSVKSLYDPYIISKNLSTKINLLIDKSNNEKKIY